MDQLSCPVCKLEDAVKQPSNFDGFAVNCRRCGNFSISRSAMASFMFDPEDVAIISGWIREQFDAGESPLLTTANVPQILKISPPSISDRIDRFILRIAKRLNFWPGWIDHNDPSLISLVYARDSDDVFELVGMLERQGYVSNISTGDFRFTAEGIIRAEQLARKNPQSRQGFVAMWFSDEMRALYHEAFEPALIDAGYMSVRVDAVEHANDINDEMIAQIKMSRFVVADLCGHRNGVYFEAGFAMGLGIPAILTCRKSEMPALHFDLRQFNCIDWVDSADLRSRLTRRIQHVVGQGPVG